MKIPIAIPDAGQVQLFDYTTGAFRALAAVGGISLTTSADGRYVTIDASALQQSLLVEGPLVMVDNNIIMLDKNAPVQPDRSIDPPRRRQQ